MISIKPKAKNTRKRSKSSATKTKRVRNTRNVRDLRDQQHRLDAEIGQLENFIAGQIIDEERDVEMRRRNILPPPEQLRRHYVRKELSRKDQQALQSERKSALIRFMVLLGVAGFLVWCLLGIGK
ncbi:MAG: hypothetical protein AAF226_02755 [Verrucomicrobiota bacterium]